MAPEDDGSVPEPMVLAPVPSSPPLMSLSGKRGMLDLHTQRDIEKGAARLQTGLVSGSQVVEDVEVPAIVSHSVLAMRP